MSSLSYRLRSPMRHLLSALAACWLAVPSPAAGETPKKWMSWTFQGENDALAVGRGSDEHYTNGVRYFGLRRPDLAPGWAQRFAGWWCGWACAETAVSTPAVGFAVGQNFYTPDDISIPERIVDDRPYAAWLYGALLLQISDRDLRRQHSFELQLGLVGPAAGGEWLQTEVHELIDSEPPLGWDNQLPNEPGLNLLYRLQRRYGGPYLDFVPHLGGALGTVTVMANAGATVRAGWNISGMPQPEIPATVAPQAAGPLAAEERPRWEFYAFAGVDGRAVAHNIFLDGTVFRDSHSVEKENFVYDLRAGLSLRYRSFRFHYAFVRRSEEFSPRRGEFDGVHNFGSFTVGVERAF